MRKLAMLLLLALPLSGQEWVTRSNANAMILLDVLNRFGPEGASRVGVESYDTEVTTLPLDANEKFIAAVSDAVKQLQAKLATETDPAVRQDLQILIDAGNRNIEGTRLFPKYQLPYFDIPLTIYNGTRFLLDDSVKPERRAKALIRLRKYTGMEPGTTPLTSQAMAYTRAHLDDKALTGPFKDNLEKDMANSARYLSGIEDLFKKYKIAGADEPLAKLKSQIAEYESFLHTDVAPRTTTDFRLPEELYRYSLRQSGVDMPVEELISRAKTSFREIQNEMNVIAPMVAKEKGIEATDYQSVIRALKKQQFAGQEILSNYQSRIKQIESIIRAQHIVTLPEREMAFRVASEAETAAVPAPHMDPPRLIGNNGERGTFVLPLHVSDASGKGEIKSDDFTYDAASWTLTAHEGRPGHELQFSALVERGVSQARVLFALNSVNVEGWALYAEAEMKPYEPLDGQLIALQNRLLRAARAFLDPSLQLGRMTREEAFYVLEQQVVDSPAMARQEVERYTFWAPGQAPSYFVGYSRLMELRADVERILGPKFDRQSFHDFILAQGPVPPSLLREAVMNDYVKVKLG